MNLEWILGGGAIVIVAAWLIYRYFSTRKKDTKDPNHPFARALRAYQVGAVSSPLGQKISPEATVSLTPEDYDAYDLGYLNYARKMKCDYPAILESYKEQHGKPHPCIDPTRSRVAVLASEKTPGGNWAIRVPTGQYEDGEYDQGGFIYAAEIVVTIPELGIDTIAIADQRESLQVAANVVDYGREHWGLAWLDYWKYRETLTHASGKGHPITGHSCLTHPEAFLAEQEGIKGPVKAITLKGSNGRNFCVLAVK